MKKQPKQLKGFECYPAWMVVLFNLINLSLYFVGLYLAFLVWPWLALIFFIYLIYNESSVYREGCVNCYYYGKMCAFGRGKIAKVFLKKGNPKKFSEKEVSFKDFIPSSFVTIVPVIAGIYLLIKGFNWLILVFTLWPLIVMFFGNPLIYGELACPNCKQVQLGCPVCEFFKKRAMQKKK